MKKLLIIGSICLLFCLLLSAALADDPVTVNDEESLVALLEQFRSANADKIEFKAAADYYKEISANDFGKLQAIGLRCGMSRYSVRNISYSDKDRLIRIYAVEWIEPHVAECNTKAEAQEAITKFITEGVTSFELICGDDISGIMLSGNLMNSYLAQCGVKKCGITYYKGKKPMIYYFDDPEFYTVPYINVSTEDEFRNALEYMWQEKKEEFYIVMTPELFKSLNGDKLDLVENASQMDRYYTDKDTSYFRYNYNYVTYSDEPRLVCTTEEEIQESVRQMGASETSEFRLVLPKSLYNSVSESKFSRLKTLFKEAGMSNYRMSYSDSGIILISEAEIHSDAVMLNSIDEAISYIETCAAEGKQEIALFCSKNLYTYLMGNIRPFALEEDVMAPIYDLISQGGLNDCSFTYSASSNIIQLHDVTYYPGFRILNAMASGDTSALTSRETETMEAAKQVAESCRGSLPLDTARNIHDWLCEKIVYTDDETTDEDDNAIGAILNGEANCDGYADAFYLIGSIAGLEVRCQHGDSYKTGLDAIIMSEVTHMWNLLKIDDSWRLVDVTWDDQEEYTTYTWFNIGQDRASRMHIWNEKMTVPLLAETDLSTRPENEYLVRTSDEVSEAARSAASQGFSTFVLVCDGNTLSEADIEARLQNTLKTSYRYSWNERMMTMTVILH